MTDYGKSPPPRSSYTARPARRLARAGSTSRTRGDGQRLWNLAPLIPEGQRFSRVYRGRGELIDHLLVSHVLGQGGADGGHGRDRDTLHDRPAQRTARTAGPGGVGSSTGGGAV